MNKGRDPVLKADHLYLFSVVVSILSFIKCNLSKYFTIPIKVTVTPPWEHLLSTIGCAQPGPGVVGDSLRPPEIYHIAEEAESARRKQSPGQSSTRS